MCGYYSIKSGLFRDMFLVSLNTSLLCVEKLYPIRIHTYNYHNRLGTEVKETLHQYLIMNLSIFGLLSKFSKSLSFVVVYN